jgi:hypothetical protein
MFRFQIRALGQDVTELVNTEIFSVPVYNKIIKFFANLFRLMINGDNTWHIQILKALTQLKQYMKTRESSLVVTSTICEQNYQNVAKHVSI